MRCVPFIALVIITLLSASVCAQELTPRSALHTALKENPRFKEAGLGVKESALKVESIEGNRPWTLNTSGGFNFDETPLSGVIDQGIRESTFYSLTAQILTQFVIGTQLSLRLDINRSTAQIPFNVPDLGISEIRSIGPNYGNVLELRVTQPILKGFGSDINDLSRDLARQQYDVANLQRLRSAQDISYEVVVSYWRWVRSVLEVEAFEASLERTKIIGELTVAQIVAGQLAELEKDIVGQRISGAEQAVILARAQSVDSYQELETLMGVAVGGEMAARPASLPDVNRDIPKLESILTAALETSPDLQLADKDIESNQMILRRGEDSVKPELNAIASISQSALSEEIPAALEQLVTAELTSVFVGFQFVIPFDNSLARKQYEADQVAVERAQLRRAEAVRQVERNVRQARRLIVTQQERLRLSEEEVELAIKNVKAVGEKYAAGLSTYLEVLDIERSLEDAQLRNAGARIDVYLAVAALRRLTGTLLDAFDIKLE